MLILLLSQRFGKENVAKIYDECKKQALQKAPSGEPKATHITYASAAPQSAQQPPSYAQQKTSYPPQNKPISTQPTQPLLQQSPANQQPNPYQISFTPYHPTTFSTTPTASRQPQQAPPQFSYHSNTRTSTTPNSYPANYNAQPSNTSNSYTTKYTYPPYSTG
jgi:hypothetical protein